MHLASLCSVWVNYIGPVPLVVCVNIGPTCAWPHAGGGGADLPASNNRGTCPRCPSCACGVRRRTSTRCPHIGTRHAWQHTITCTGHHQPRTYKCTRCTCTQTIAQQTQHPHHRHHRHHQPAITGTGSLTLRRERGHSSQNYGGCNCIRHDCSWRVDSVPEGQARPPQSPQNSPMNTPNTVTTNSPMNSPMN